MGFVLWIGVYEGVGKAPRRSLGRRGENIS
jgi:hypothetical protein